MSLSSLIVLRELASMRDVEEALARQVIYGGDLATNLLEIVHLDEARLTAVVAEAMNLPAAPSGPLPRPADNAAGLVPAELAVRYAVVPLALEQNRLILAVAEPLGIDATSSLASAAGMTIALRAALSVRVHQAIAMLTGVALERRFQRLVDRLSGPSEAKPTASSRPSSPIATAKSVPRSQPPSDRANRRRRGPLTIDAAKEAAEKAEDRDALVELFFDFARQFFDYSALFLIHGDIADGRDAHGAGASRERVAGLGVPLDLPSLIANARERRVPLIALPPPEGLEAVLMTDLQRSAQAEIAIVPLVVRTRAVALLVGDCGAVGIDRESTQQIAAFGGVIGKAFERLIVRRKLDGFIAGSRATALGRVTPDRVGAKRVSTAPSERESHLPPSVGMASIRPLSSPPIPREEPLSEPRAGSTRGTSPMPPDPSLAHAAKKLTPEPPRPSQVPTQNLPSVVVDLGEEDLSPLVDRWLASPADETIAAELLRHGARAMPAIMARFPGPLMLDRTRIATMAVPPHAIDCGPLLGLLARQRRVALPFVLDKLSASDPEHRGWAFQLLLDLPYAEGIPQLLAGLRDADPSTRTSAGFAFAAIARGFPKEARSAALSITQSANPVERAAAISALGQLRDPALVPELVRALADGAETVVRHAHEALVRVTLQDFGTDARPWLRWWESHAFQHRIEWLIDALSHEVAELRKTAGDELRSASKQYFGFAADLPSRDRDRVQQRYRDWWSTEGHAQFKKNG